MVRIKVDARKAIAEMKDLERKFQVKILRKAMREGCKVVTMQVKANAHNMLNKFATGTTAKAVKTRAMKRKKGRIGYLAQIGEGAYKGKTFYASFIENGYWITRKVGGTKTKITKVAPTHFMQRAAQQAKDHAVESLFQSVKSQLAKYA